MSKFILPALLLVTLQAGAQGMFGVYIKAYDPRGAFQQNVKTTPLGMGFDYFRHVRGSRFTIGGELGMAMYTDFTYTGTIPSGQTIRIYEEDCFWTAHAEVRYHFFQSPAIKTYMQARIGFTTFFSSLQSDDPNVTYDKFQFHGTAFNTGVGLGVMINTRKLFTGGEPGNVNIDLGAGLHSGTATNYRYVTRDQNIPLDQGRYNSLTNYMDFRIGVIMGAPWQ